MCFQFNKGFAIFAAVSTCLLFASNSWAADKLYIRNPKQVITKSPGGGKIGELYINTPVMVEELGESWTQVTVKAWVRTKGLVEKSRKKKASAIGFDTGVLKVAEFSTRIVREDVPSPRAYVTLHLKNTGDRPIYSWSGMLVAQANDEVLFREPLSDDTKSIMPSKVVEVSFFWEGHEKPFNYIVSAKEDELKFQLLKLKINR
jgi:hypothetical protein